MENVMKQVEGGVCAAKGFSANGLNCGLNPNKEKNDLALIYSEKMCNAAAVYTTNKVKGAPILVTKKNLAASGNHAQADRITLITECVTTQYTAKTAHTLQVVGSLWSKKERLKGNTNARLDETL